MARKNPNKNPNTKSNNSVQTNNPNGINWGALGNQPGEVNWDTLSGPIEKEAKEVRNQALGEMAIRAVNNYRDARKKAAYIGSYYEMVDKKVKKDETGLLQKGVVYTMLKEKYGNTLDRQGRYKEKLESLPGTTSHPEWISGDIMVDIANRIPKIKGQTGKEYVEYITKIRDQIPPRRKNEDIEAYKQRILEVFNTGDLQFIAANALMDPQPEIDQQIKERLERIKGLEKELGQTSGMAQEKQNKLRGKLKQAKLDLYKIAVSAEEEDIEARKCKSNTGEKTSASEEQRYKVRRKSIFHKIASPVLKLFDSKDERRGSRRRNKLREKAKKEGMATISDLIPKMEWQTKDDYKEFIARIYSEHPKLTSDTSDEYKRDINNADFYASVACALIDSQSSNGHTDGVGEEMRAKFEQIDATLNGGFSSDGATELDARIKEARIKALKDIVEKEIKASPNH